MKGGRTHPNSRDITGSMSAYNKTIALKMTVGNFLMSFDFNATAALFS